MPGGVEMAADGRCAMEGAGGRVWKFGEILEEPRIREKWEKVRRYFFLRESTYDLTRRCNIRCDGCYFYEGAKQHAPENPDPEAWRRLMQAEKARGITYVVLAGAEPALVPAIVQACHAEMPLGTVATNGLVPIPADVGYRLHISVWGNDATSRAVRGAKDMLARQAANYQGDERAVFVYTFTARNIAESHAVADYLAARGCRLTFNVFSAPESYSGPLRHSMASLVATRRAMLEITRRHPGHVLFSAYNAVVHTHALGLHDLFACPYPRRNPSTSLGLGRSFRQYRVDLSWDRGAACCVPDTDCADCRHYAAGSAIVTAKMFRHAVHPRLFAAWLDYVDTYLAVWVTGYVKSPDLVEDLVDPPGVAREGCN